MARLSKGLASSDSANLKVVVYWGDVLYDQILCGPSEALTVGRIPGNRIVVPADELITSRDTLELIKVNKDGSVDLTFDDSIGGYVFLSKKFKRLSALVEAGQVDHDPDGTHRVRLTRGDRGECVLGHLTFSFDWVKESVTIPRTAWRERKRSLLISGGITAAIMLLTFLVALIEPAEEPPPERLVRILPKYRPPPQAKAAMGEKKTEDGGAAKAPEGKAEVKPKPKPSEAEQLRNALSGDLVQELADIGTIAPDRATAESDAAVTAALDQASTGGSSTKGFKTGAGGKSVGIGRTEGQGEGGFAGTGRMGLAGNAAVETSSGRGGYETEMRGGLDRDVIDSIVRKKQDRVRLCYERQLNFKPDLAGKVTIHFVIGADGKVLSSNIAEDTMRSRPVNDCILNEVRDWVFPRPKGGTKVEVDYPFVFESSVK